MLRTGRGGAAGRSVNCNKREGVTVDMQAHAPRLLMGWQQMQPIAQFMRDGPWDGHRETLFQQGQNPGAGPPRERPKQGLQLDPEIR